MRILVTGGAGFIGSNFIGHVQGAHPADRVVNLDKLTCECTSRQPSLTNTGALGWALLDRPQRLAMKRPLRSMSTAIIGAGAPTVGRQQLPT